jgi:hypothetical protein
MEGALRDRPAERRRAPSAEGDASKHTHAHSHRVVYVRAA